jgi:hypothetical protein
MVLHLPLASATPQVQTPVLPEKKRKFRLGFHLGLPIDISFLLIGSGFSLRSIRKTSLGLEK